MKTSFLYGYIIGRGISLSRLLIIMLVFALFGTAVSSKNSLLAGDKQRCLAKLDGQGILKTDYQSFTDGQVAEVCGYIPDMKVNSEWHRTRKRPVNEERLQELRDCEQSYRDAGKTPDRMHRDSDAQIAILCDAVPFYLD